MVPEVVLHPYRPKGLRVALDAVLPDAAIGYPTDSDGVYGSLRDGASILATYLWEDRFLQPNLRWVASFSSGFTQFPLDAFGATGVMLTTARGVNHVATAEHAIALLLSLTRRIQAIVIQSQSRTWQRLPAETLLDKTVAVVGLGSVGGAVARRLTAFGARVIGVKRTSAEGPRAAERIFGIGELVPVFENSDAAILALPGGEDTRHIVDGRALRALGEAWLVNVGRGSVIDEGALVRALTEGRLLGAGLDVFEEEPLPDSSPLWELSNVLVSPHMAGSSGDYADRWADRFRHNMLAYRGAREWDGLVLNDHMSRRK